MVVLVSDEILVWEIDILLLQAPRFYSQFFTIVITFCKIIFSNYIYIHIQFYIHIFELYLYSYSILYSYF